MDWIGLLENNELLKKVFGISLMISLLIIPGSLLLLIEWTEIFFNQGLAKLIFVSFVLSVPLIFAELFMYMSGIPDILPSNKGDFPTTIKLFKVMISTYILSLVIIGLLYIFVRIPKLLNPINGLFDASLKSSYIANYFLILFLIFIMTIMNLKKANNKTNQKSND